MNQTTHKITLSGVIHEYITWQFHDSVLGAFLCREFFKQANFLSKAGEERALFSRKNGEIQICQEKKRVLLRFSNKFFLEVVTVL